MPLPKSDKIRVQLMLDPATLANLDAYATRHGLINTVGTTKGEPNRSWAVRELAAKDAKRNRKKGGG